MKFTDKYIDSRKPESKQYVKREGDGFAIRVLPSGVKTWLFIYTFDGKRRQMNLGSYPGLSLADARTAYSAAYSILNDKQNPRDPQAERNDRHKAEREERTAQILAPTVKKLIEKYVKWIETKKDAKAPRSVYNDKRALEFDVLPKWGALKVADIRRGAAIQLLEEVAARAPGQARYLANVCRSMFDYALDRQMIEANPFIIKAKTIPELKYKSRERTLTAEEIKTVWSEIETGAGSEATKSIIKLILVTGQRPSEVCGMRESEIDGDWWTIPEERMKNKKAHRVYLTALAKSLIPATDKDIIFTANGEKPIHVGTLSYALKRSNFYGIPHWTPHDARRTCRTFLAEIGVPRDHAEAVLSHTLQGVEGTYNRYRYDKEKQAALEKWERKLKIIIGSPATAKVVNIR